MGNKNRHSGARSLLYHESQGALNYGGQESGITIKASRERTLSIHGEGYLWPS